MSSEMNLVEFFKKELESESVAEKVAVLQKTKYIASAVGVQLTKDYILPVLIEHIHSESDEILFSIGEQLAVVSNFLGLSPENIVNVIPPLEILAGKQETVVRDQAIRSLVKVLEKAEEINLCNMIITEYYIPITERLSQADWFTSRVSATRLIPIIYKHCTEKERDILHQIFSKLCQDETPMVRRAASTALSDIIQFSDHSSLLKTFYIWIQLFWKDPQMYLRTSALTACVALSKQLTPDENYQKTFCIFKTAAEDLSWRIRFKLATVFDEIVLNYKPRILELMPAFILLLNDIETEVSIAAFQALGRFVGHMTPDDIKHSSIIDSLLKQAAGSVLPITTAIADIIVPVACAVGRDFSLSTIFDTILTLLNDDVSCQLNIVRHAGELCDVMGLETVSQSLVQALELLSVHSQRRVRLEVVNQIAKLAPHFGPEAFQSRLEVLYLNAFSDVYAVRQAAVQNLEILGRSFGSSWIATALLPQLLKKYYGTSEGHIETASPPAPVGYIGQLDPIGAVDNHSCSSVSYLTRITVIQALPNLVNVLPVNELEDTIIPLLLTALKDHVANVRFAAARAIKELRIQHTISDIHQIKKIKSVLETLATEDYDIDVHFYVLEALQIM